MDESPKTTAHYQYCEVLKCSDLQFADAAIQRLIRGWLTEWAKEQKDRLTQEPERSVALRISCQVIDQSASVDDWIKLAETAYNGLLEFAKIAKASLDKWCRTLRHHRN